MAVKAVNKCLEFSFGEISGIKPYLPRQKAGMYITLPSGCSVVFSDTFLDFNVFIIFAKLNR